MTLIAVNTTPTTCPQCGGVLSLPLGSKARPGMVVQTCKNFQLKCPSVWSAVGEPRMEPVIDDGSRHARFLLPATSEPEPAPVYATKNWTSISRLAKRELAELNRQDRKLAAAGGDL